MTVGAPEKRGLKIKIWPEGGFPEKAGPREVAVLSCWWEGQGRYVAGRQRAAAAGPEPRGWADPAGRSPGGTAGPGPGWIAPSARHQAHSFRGQGRWAQSSLSAQGAVSWLQEARGPQRLSSQLIVTPDKTLALSW